MTDLFTYLIKVNIALSLFYLIYHLWLRKLTFYTVNRYFLLFAVIFSSLYPLINWNWYQSNSNLSPQVVELIPVWKYEYSNSQQIAITEHIDQLFYLTLAVFGLRLFIGLLGVLRIHLSSTASIWKAYNYRKSEEDIMPFSFWRYVYLNPSKHKVNELEGIFRHEYVHVRQLHTLDILLGELVLLFCWYNPVAWLFRRVIRENIEFITDSNVLASGINKQAYQYSLLTVLTSNKQSSIANHFNMKDLKKRIRMMNRKRTSGIHIVKYIMLVPIIIGCLSAFTISEARQRSLAPQEMIQSIRSLNILKPKTITVDTVQTDTLAKGKPRIEVRGPEKIDTVNKAQAPTGLKVRIQDSTEMPLYIIDGEVNDAKGLSNIDPKDIKAVNVIKGIKAIALYGERGKNGVIEITLKGTTSDINANAESLKAENSTVSVEDSSSLSFRIPRHEEGSPKKVGYQIIYIDGEKKTQEDLQKLDINIIESVSVYKGKTAVERYGSGAEDGVAVITTKQPNL